MAEYSPEQYLASLLTTPEQEARNLRASRSRQRILALGDALRHIGNIYNTTQGAPAQQFNDPVTAERTRYQQDRLLRDANNMKYFSYQQAKQAQDLAMQKNKIAMQKSQWDMLNGAARLELEQKKFTLQQEMAQAKLAGDEATAKYKQAQIDRINALLPGELQKQKAQINQANAAAGASSARARKIQHDMNNPTTKSNVVTYEYSEPDYMGRRQIVKKKTTYGSVNDYSQFIEDDDEDDENFDEYQVQ